MTAGFILPQTGQAIVFKSPDGDDPIEFDDEIGYWGTIGECKGCG